MVWKKKGKKSLVEFNSVSGISEGGIKWRAHLKSWAVALYMYVSV